MSFNLLVISEDPTNNGYIFIPLIKRMMKECGKPNSRVALMTDPKASGYENAKSLIREVVIERYAYKDLLLFLPDADGCGQKQLVHRSSRGVPGEAFGEDICKCMS